MKATREQIKNQNTSLVLRTVYQARGISRADIARATDLTRPTVSSIISNLMELKLVKETGFGPSIGGKPPVMLEIDTSTWRILCVDIGNQEFRGALVSLRGEVDERITLPGNDLTGEDAIQRIYQIIETLVKETTIPVLGIGVGSPGLINPQTGVVRQAVNLGWNNLPLKELISKRFDYPIYIANDSQAAALGEYTFGNQRTSDHLLAIRVGRGIGAGIILNGQIFYGDGSGAGEIGHVILNGATLEAQASTRAILRRGREIAGREISWDDLVEMISTGNTRLRQVVEDAAQALGISLASLIGALNINTIVLSGRLDQFGELFLDTAYRTASQRVLPELMDNTSIRYSTLGSDIVLLGCAAFILKYELGII